MDLDDISTIAWRLQRTFVILAILSISNLVLCCFFLRSGILASFIFIALSVFGYIAVHQERTSRLFAYIVSTLTTIGLVILCFFVSTFLEWKVTQLAGLIPSVIIMLIQLGTVFEVYRMRRLLKSGRNERESLIPAHQLVPSPVVSIPVYEMDRSSDAPAAVPTVSNPKKKDVQSGFGDDIFSS
eukprot:TRINITY_DN12848_c0_g1_i1.p1 TRINITY_DN12848_c0_g1~~TRINITY_DN12848_c0_g1_i1.p1  ORF type:complete len:184 (+),score=28.32 TRINITY_DN12848_c0_g1_i1:140-691(+)